MEYVERVNAAQRHTGEVGVLPPSVFGYALSLKQPYSLQHFETPLEFANSSPEHQQIYKARKIGNHLVRFAVATDIAAKVDPSIEPLREMTESSRREILNYMTRSDSDSFLPEVNIDDETVISRIAESKQAIHTKQQQRLIKRAYVDIRPGSFPPTSWPRPPFGNNDVTLIQSFGRGTYTDEELPTVVEVRASFESALDPDEATFRYLETEKFDPGKSNEALAEVVRHQLLNPNVAIEQILQWETAYALWVKNPTLFATYRPAIHVLWPSSDFYPTYEVKADSVAVMQRVGLYNPYELSHPDMLVRAIGILGKQGVQADALIANIPFDESSVQFQTRGPAQWMAREAATRLHHVLTRRVKL